MRPTGRQSAKAASPQRLHAGRPTRTKAQSDPTGDRGRPAETTGPPPPGGGNRAFTDEGYATWLPGFLSGEASCQGFADPSLAITVGSTATVSLGAGDSYAIGFSGLIVDASLSSSVSGAAEVELTIKTNGAFTPTLALA